MTLLKYTRLRTHVKSKGGSGGKFSILCPSNASPESIAVPIPTVNDETGKCKHFMIAAWDTW
ncbi:hypothetical protein Poly51_02970 [Rubripirellula tenax]|uniref:Uncharacterized protein n=1 Tax=Rubripirellula tenax TaxID=2528015 RepID=A0A5C6FHJ4_9BACT|nr:hypothetical protein Poly51_02970 [Rubripirellula tenax]